MQRQAAFTDLQRPRAVCGVGQQLSTRSQRQEELQAARFLGQHRSDQPRVLKPGNNPTFGKPLLVRGWPSPLVGKKQYSWIGGRTSSVMAQALLAQALLKRQR